MNLTDNNQHPPDKRSTTGLNRHITNLAINIVRIIKNQRFCTVAVIIILIFCIIPQYSEELGIPKTYFPWRLIGFQRHTVERFFCLIPIAYATIVLGSKAGIIVSIISLPLMLPRTILFSPNHFDSTFEVFMVSAIGIFFSLYIQVQITAKQQKEQDMVKLKKMEGNLRFYVRQAVMAQEEERKRISRELHDDTIQILGGLSREIDNFIRRRSSLDPEDISRLKGLRELLNEGLKEIHRFTQDLRPSLLDYLGLLTAIKSLVHKAIENYKIGIDVTVKGVEKRFRPEIETLIFRIIQEALNNIGRHSGATEAHIFIEFDDTSTTFIISDNGKGFDIPVDIEELPRIGKLGLAGMQERVELLTGTMHIESAYGKGTVLTITIPS